MFMLRASWLRLYATLLLAGWQNRRQLAIVEIGGLISSSGRILSAQLCVVQRLVNFHVYALHSRHVALEVVDEIFGLYLNFDFLLDSGQSVIAVAGVGALLCVHFSKFKINA